MSKKLMMNSKINNETIILCKDFSPNGQPFVLWEDKMIDWDKYELYINIDIPSITNDKWRHILILSSDGVINVFAGEKLHIYYKDKVIKMQSGRNNSDVNFNLLSNNNIQIILNKDGFYINGKILNGELYDNVFTTWYDIIQKPITIGNQNPNNLSVCTYNLIQLQPYQERGK